MKFIFIVLLLSSTSYGDSIEFITGGLTYHPMMITAVSKNFVGKLTSDGKLIYNQLYGVGYTKYHDFTYNSYKFFTGHNSIGENIGGVSYSLGFTDRRLDIGLMVGIYRQDGELFNRKVSYLWMDGNYVPLVGFEFNYKVMLTDTKFIKLNNYLSPVITNHTVSIGENF